MSKIRSGISQATVSAEGVISAEGNIGKNKTSGSIDSEGIWDLGIDFKVGGLGITNDYGGAITVSIAGQSITWGREGGMIHYDLGGFEVIVEARDCVITETKKIMGIEVASHTYPDPGCKLPEPEPPPPPQTPTNPDDPIAVEIPDVDVQGWVFVHIKSSGYDVGGEFGSSLVLRTILSPVEERLPAYVGRAPLKISSQTRRLAPAPAAIFPEVVIEKNGVQLFVHQIPIYEPIAVRNSSGNFVNVEITRQNASSIYFTGDRAPLFFWGSFKEIKKFIEINDANIIQRMSLYPTSYRVGKYIPFLCVPYYGNVDVPKPKPFLQPGVPPYMNNDCCEEVLDILEELRDALGSEEITKAKGKNKGRLLEKFIDKPKREKLKDKTFVNCAQAIDAILSELQNFEKILHADFFHEKKFPVPTNLLIPGAEGGSVEAISYYHLVKHLFQAFAHGTIINPVIAIQDTDAVKEGDQTLNSQYLSATGWAEAVTKMLYEIVDDGNVGTNMDIRTGVTATQTLVALADLSYKVDCIIDCIGVTTKRSKGEVETSYNLVLDQDDKIKGFDPKKANKPLDLNDDTTTEKLLSSLLKTRKNPIVKEEIHPKASSLVELLEGLKNKQ